MLLVLLQTATTYAPSDGGSTVSSELLSGFAGAFAVFLIGAVGGGVLRRRERIGLMTVVHLEVMHNERLLDQIHDAPELVDSGQIELLRYDTWKQNNSRIAQLARGRSMDYLGTYYTMLETLVDGARLRSETQGERAPSREELEEILDPLQRTFGPLARYTCERHTGWRRGWSNGMLVVGGRFERVAETERTWYFRGPPS